MVAQPLDRAIQNGGTGGPLTDFFGYFRGKSRLRRLPHHTEYLLDALLRDEAQERRLSQLHSHALTQRAVEDGVAGGVSEVSENDRVLIGEFSCAMQIQIQVAGEENHKQSRDAGNQQLPMLCRRYCGGGPRAVCLPPRLGVPLEAPQIHAYARSALVAKVSVFFNAL